MRARRVLTVRDAPGEGARAQWPPDPVEVLRILYPRLLAAARTVDPTGAEDLVQDALIETLVRHPDFRGMEHPLGYAKVVMFRLAFRRRGRRLRTVPPEAQECLERTVDSDPADRIADRLQLHSALARLGRNQRACVVLRHVEGVDDANIAAILGCSPSTVRSQIARALAHMRATFDETKEVDEREP